MTLTIAGDDDDEHDVDDVDDAGNKNGDGDQDAEVYVFTMAVGVEMKMAMQMRMWNEEHVDADDDVTDDHRKSDVHADDVDYGSEDAKGDEDVDVHVER